MQPSSNNQTTSFGARRLAKTYKEFIQERHFVFVLLGIIFLNLLIIDFFLFKKPQQPATSSLTQATHTTVATGTTPTDTCSRSCIAEISKLIPTPVTTTTQIIAPTTSPSGVKEYFVPLGTGSGSSTTWQDVSGIQGYVDRNSYGTLKKVTFEVSLYTPTGNQTTYVRLYNITDQHPVWNSDVTGDGGTSQLKISQPITLDVGSKLYSVQMMTQLGAITQVQNARIHILTN